MSWGGRERNVMAVVVWKGRKEGVDMEELRWKKSRVDAMTI